MIRLVTRITSGAYWGVLGLIFFSIVFGLWYDVLQQTDVRRLGYYLPALAMISVISSHLDLLSSISDNGRVNIKARIYDFAHWLGLIGINIGAWLHDGVTIWWFFLKLVLLGIIGFQIGMGLSKQLAVKLSDRVVGVITAVIALSAGLLTGYIRTIDASDFGWGWILETITAMGATLIVAKWISDDLKTFRYDTRGYPRSYFFKGMIGNVLLLWFWYSFMVEMNIQKLETWHINLGLTFNVLVGNGLYIVYYAIYEKQRLKQRPKTH